MAQLTGGFRGDGNDDPFEALVEDLIKNNSGIIRITLGNLPAGLFSVTSYHADPFDGQAGRIEVHVSTDGCNNYYGPVAIGTSKKALLLSGTAQDDAEESAAEFDFISNGVDDVCIIFDGTSSSDKETPLNGLKIDLIDDEACLA